jgi:hypothetical protein
MGQQRNRKRERKVQQRLDKGALIPRWDAYPSARNDELALLFGMQRRDEHGQLITTCVSCREYVENADGGRGECLHPGSGILSPWNDTAACDFHQRSED